MGGVAFELPRPRGAGTGRARGPGGAPELRFAAHAARPYGKHGRAACEPADVLWPDATRCAVAKHENFFLVRRTGHPLSKPAALSLCARALHNLNHTSHDKGNTDKAVPKPAFSFYG